MTYYLHGKSGNRAGGYIHGSMAATRPPSVVSTSTSSPDLTELKADLTETKEDLSTIEEDVSLLTDRVTTVEDNTAGISTGLDGQVYLRAGAPNSGAYVTVQDQLQVTGHIRLNLDESKTVKNLGDPQDLRDACPKIYVDNSDADLSGRLDVLESDTRGISQPSGDSIIRIVAGDIDSGAYVAIQDMLQVTNNITLDRGGVPFGTVKGVRNPTSDYEVANKRYVDGHPQFVRTRSSDWYQTDITSGGLTGKVVLDQTAANSTPATATWETLFNYQSDFNTGDPTLVDGGTQLPISARGETEIFLLSKCRLFEGGENKQDSTIRVRPVVWQRSGNNQIQLVVRHPDLDLNTYPSISAAPLAYAELDKVVSGETQFLNVNMRVASMPNASPIASNKQRIFIKLDLSSLDRKNNPISSLNLFNADLDTLITTSNNEPVTEFFVGLEVMAFDDNGNYPHKLDVFSETLTRQ